MDKDGGPIAVPTADKRQARRIPLVWIVPLITALIGVWLAWDTFSKRGPTITIAFESAGGLQAGQSQLKFKDVTMGTVKSLAVSPDFSQVIVTVETTREAEPLLSDKTVFWVVKPELFAGRISGLDTLLSGSYIGMLPSTEKGKSERHFVGSANPPVLTASAPGTIFKLETRRVGSISLANSVALASVSGGMSVKTAPALSLQAMVSAARSQTKAACPSEARMLETCGTAGIGLPRFGTPPGDSHLKDSGSFESDARRSS